MTEDELRELLRGNNLTPPAGISTAPLAGVKRRAKRRRRLTAGFSAVAVCALAGLAAMSLRGSATPVAAEQCGSAVPVFSSAKPVLVGPTPQPINAGSLSEITNAAGLIGEERFPESYAGVAMDTETDRVKGGGWVEPILFSG